MAFLSPQTAPPLTPPTNLCLWTAVFVKTLQYKDKMIVCRMILLTSFYQINPWYALSLPWNLKVTLAEYEVHSVWDIKSQKNLDSEPWWENIHWMKSSLLAYCEFRRIMAYLGTMIGKNKRGQRRSLANTQPEEVLSKFWATKTSWIGFDHTERHRQSLLCVDHPTTQHWAPVTYLCSSEQFDSILCTWLDRPKDRHKDKGKDMC